VPACVTCWESSMRTGYNDVPESSSLFSVGSNSTVKDSPDCSSDCCSLIDTQTS
jgi:hypothetical protein